MGLVERTIELLRGGPVSLSEVANRLGMPVKDFLGFFERFKEKIPAGSEIRIEFAYCRDCGFVFRDKHWVFRPSKCPNCRSEATQAPKYSLVSR